MWYVQWGAQWRPASDDELKNLVGVGTVRADTLIRHDSWAHPAPAGTAPFLRDYFPPNPGPQPHASQLQRAPTQAGPQRGKKGGPGWKLLLLLLGGILVARIFMALAWVGLVLGLAIAAFAIVAWMGKVRLPTFIPEDAGKKRRILGVTAVSGLLFGSCGVIGIGERHEAAKKEEQRLQVEAAKAEQALLAEQALQKRRAEIPTLVKTWREELDKALVHAETNSASAHERAKAIAKEIADEQVQLGNPIPQELIEAGQYARKIQGDVEKYIDLANALIGIPADTEKGKMAAAAQKWIDADASYDSALSSIGYLESLSEPWRSKIPASFDLAGQRRRVEALKRGIAGAVARERTRIERAEAKRKAEEEKAAAYRALCGEAPVLSPWDGEVVGLESVIQRTAHDPDSIDVENCTQPILSEKNCWVFSCQVRGKNAFGAKVLNQHTYSHSRLGFEQLK
ncbi:hypothetical protein [Sorangium sp. So ce854]|uniref:hypothetical protein n=1 Tax=Sorangium sp. So ce854 TaxID=3133322 RepID=UPI003F62CBDF